MFYIVNVKVFSDAKNDNTVLHLIEPKARVVLPNSEKIERDEAAQLLRAMDDMQASLARVVSQVRGNLAVLRSTFPRFFRELRRPAGFFSRIGDHILFYGAALKGVPHAIVHYRREIVRLIAEMSHQMEHPAFVRLGEPEDVVELGE